MEQACAVNDERDSDQQTAPYDFVEPNDVIQVALKKFVHGFLEMNAVPKTVTRAESGIQTDPRKLRGRALLGAQAKGPNVPPRSEASRRARHSFPLIWQTPTRADANRPWDKHDSGRW